MSCVRSHDNCTQTRQGRPLRLGNTAYCRCSHSASSGDQGQMRRPSTNRPAVTTVPTSATASIVGGNHTGPHRTRVVRSKIRCRGWQRTLSATWLRPRSTVPRPIAPLRAATMHSVQSTMLLYAGLRTQHDALAAASTTSTSGRSAPDEDLRLSCLVGDDRKHP